MNCKSNGRKPISKRVRFEIFKRDQFTCQYCGAQPPSVILHVDHIVPVAKGGENGSENLVTACQSCNLGKSSIPLSSTPKSLEETAKEEAERSEQVEAHAAQIRETREKIEAAIWEVAEILEPGASDGWSRDKYNGVKMFVDRLGFGTVLESAYIAEDAKASVGTRFKYFCGVCWNRVRERG